MIPLGWSYILDKRVWLPSFLFAYITQFSITALCTGIHEIRYLITVLYVGTWEGIKQLVAVYIIEIKKDQAIRC